MKEKIREILTVKRGVVYGDFPGLIADLEHLVNQEVEKRIADKMVSERDELQVLMNDISEWSDKTFGEGQRNPEIVHHLKKEVDELIEAINKAHGLGGDQSVGVGEYGRQLKNTRTEYADCMMLLLDSALHFGISAKELLSLTREKLEVNKARKWGKPDENGVVEHVKEPTAEGAEEIDDETIAWAAEHQCGTPFSERWIGFVKGAKWHRSRLTNDSQKTEGGGE